MGKNKHILNVNIKAPSEKKCLDENVEMTPLNFVALRCVALCKLQYALGDEPVTCNS